MRKIQFLVCALVLHRLAAFAAEEPSNESMVTAAGQTAVHWKGKIIDFVLDHGPGLLGALLVLSAGWILAGLIYRLVNRTLEKRRLEPPIRMLISRVVHVAVLGVAFIIALETLGFKMTTVIAGISVAGVGVGLAMQGVLGNLVSGLVIIFTKPFRVGEYIDVIGEYGQVESIELFSTILLHPDQSRLIIPNRKIVGEVLHNYGTVRQLDMAVGVAYDTDLRQALETVRDVLRNNSRIAKEIAPAVGISTLGDSSINIAVKPWVNVNDYGAAKAEIYQALVERFRDRNIQIPFPQREIRVLNGNGALARAG